MTKTLTIYGTPRSKASKVLWTAQELGLDFERIDVQVGRAGEDQRLLKLTPNGRMPAMVDAQLVLSESNAIAIYLARTYGLGGLYPAPAAQAWLARCVGRPANRLE